MVCPQWFGFAALMRLAGLLHYCQIPAMMMAPSMMGWKEDMAKLSPINQVMFKVITKFILFTVLGLGAVVAWGADEISRGGRLAVGLSLFLGIFWLVRGLIQIRVYSKIWPAGLLGWASHRGLILLFSLLAIIYITNAVRMMVY